MTKAKYKAPPRICSYCKNKGTILWPQGTKKGDVEAAYLCIWCARRLYPDQYPPAPKQLEFSSDRKIGRSTRNGMAPQHLVPIDRDAS